MFLFDKTDDAPAAASAAAATTDGNQEGELTAETLKEKIRLIEVRCFLAVCYNNHGSPIHGDIHVIVLIWKRKLYYKFCSKKDYLVNFETSLMLVVLTGVKSNLFVILECPSVGVMCDFCMFAC